MAKKTKTHKTPSVQNIKYATAHARKLEKITFKNERDYQKNRERMMESALSFCSHAEVRYFNVWGK